VFNLAEELYLLSIYEKKHKIVFSENVVTSYALAGAILADLLLLQKIKVEKDQFVRVEDENLPDDPLLKLFFGKIIKEKNPRKIKFWINNFSRDEKMIKEKIREQLLKKKVIKGKKKKFFWLPYKEFQMFGTSAKFITKEILRMIVLGNEKGETRSIVLLNLIRVCNLLNHIFTKDEIVAALFRVLELVKNEEIGNFVIDALEDISLAISMTGMAAASS
jgi:uncharacterized metal-binding protein